MTSTHRTTIATRVSQCLVATTLMAGIAFGATPIASAKPKLDQAAYEKCITDFTNKHPNLHDIEYYNLAQRCCELNGGKWNRLGTINNNGYCSDPDPEAENLPQPGQPAEPPPVLQNPPAQPSNPLIPTPRGPNSGTLG